MKLGPVDGNAEEVRDLLENNGLRLEDFLEKAAAPLKTRYLIIPGVIFAVGLLAVVAFGSESSKTIRTLLYLLAFGGGMWLTVSIQLRFRNGPATFAAAVGALLMLLIAAGIFSLQDTAEFVKGIRKDN
jgi:peptidoglycan/LPS O-acetylase OafA/YrhL